MTKIWGFLRAYFEKTDKLFWALCISASVYGIILLASVSRAGTNYVKTQIMAVALGYFAAIVISVMDYNFLAKLWPVAAALGAGLVVLTYFIGYGGAGADDVAWLILPGGVSFQPAELLKICFILTFAKHLSVLKAREKLRNFFHICLLVVHAAIPALLVHLQGDDGTALIFIFIFLFMSLGAGIQWRYFALVLVCAVAAAPVAWNMLMNEDQKKRFITAFNPESDPLGIGYQQTQGKISIASGELNGRGLFQGPRVLKQSVPEQQNDFIFSVAGEELGFIGCIALIAILLFLLLRVLQNAGTARDSLGQYLCFGFFGMIASQSILNIAMCLGLAPVIGITLPFFSAGGSSVACLYLGVGLVQSVHMHREDPDKVTLQL